ncbi:hypothetical protein GCM10027052_26160 [Parafrigoribacterium mesophilum]|uniref:class I SAM-dependent methyltransferase n=1 Tax=Parafrigoribacterium mesophilum TaxID=433646 RepID=UPI0031FC0C68
MAEDDVAAWSAVAERWSEVWGTFPEPVWRAIIAASGIGRGTRVLDIGCGSGEFLHLLEEVGAVAAGVDPAPGMVAVARSHSPGADLRRGFSEQLPWPDASFDVVTAINSLHFSDDVVGSMNEARRVTTRGGLFVVANWAEGERNDLNVIEEAVRVSVGEDLMPDAAIRLPGGLERLLAAGGFDLVTAGIVEAPWQAPDDNALAAGVLLGESAAAIATATPLVVEAARPFRTSDGYRLVNAFRFAVGRAPA